MGILCATDRETSWLSGMARAQQVHTLHHPYVTLGAYLKFLPFRRPSAHVLTCLSACLCVLLLPFKGAHYWTLPRRMRLSTSPTHPLVSASMRAAVGAE